MVNWTTKILKRFCSKTNKCHSDRYDTEKLLRYQESYKGIVERIKKQGKCRVVFYVFEIAKWKTDSLYRLMQKDSRFEPIIVIAMTPGRINFYSDEEKKERFDKYLAFFKSKGYEVYSGFDLKRNKNLSLKEFKPDVVFYQQHLGNGILNDVVNVRKYALTCYVPYNVPNYVNLEYDYDNFCRKIFRFYVVNEQLKDYYASVNDDSNMRATGHTALDEFYLNRGKPKENKYVIYAPHFSIMHPHVHNKFYYGTFNYNAKLILKFAQQHPELNWVFKPHPNLIESLRRMLVPEEEINGYYNAWRKIGIVCEDSDYVDMFANAKAMITDCGSFCTEFFCTGKPLIHLIHPISINWPCEAMRPMFDSFYEAHNNEELLQLMDKILLKNEDDRKEERLKVLKELHLGTVYAAQNIMDDLTSTLFETGEKS
ncbi:MAG: hypothetical protein VZR95_03740 [Alphaproteobacteria bacterium]